MHSFPLKKPDRPFFSSGPCAKPQGWGAHVLEGFLQGRSHRAAPALQQLQDVLSKMRSILGIPADYEVAIVPGSATAALEMGLWNFLGARGADVWSFDLFGRRWAEEVRDQLSFEDVRFFDADDGLLPNFSQADFMRDQVFTWCGTTSGVWLEQIDWISKAREGLTICDATSAVFVTELPWALLDVTAFSWQKGLGSEAGQGMVVLSPRAFERLKAYTPPWPVPRILRLKDDPFVTRQQMEGSVFAGFTLNTPSMLAVADCLWALHWAEEQGGMPGLLKRVAANFECVSAWVARTPWLSFLAKEPRARAKSAVCLVITDPFFVSLPLQKQRAFLGHLAGQLAEEGVAFDCINHAFATPGFRLWCGPTIETQDLEALFPWLEWGFEQMKRQGASFGKTLSTGEKQGSILSQDLRGRR